MIKDLFIKDKTAYCGFCNEPCNKGVIAPSESEYLNMFWWWHCNNCKVSFLAY